MIDKKAQPTTLHGGRTKAALQQNALLRSLPLKIEPRVTAKVFAEIRDPGGQDTLVRQCGLWHIMLIVCAWCAAVPTLAGALAPALAPALVPALAPALVPDPAPVPSAPTPFAAASHRGVLVPKWLTYTLDDVVGGD